MPRIAPHIAPFFTIFQQKGLIGPFIAISGRPDQYQYIGKRKIHHAANKKKKKEKIDIVFKRIM